MWSPKISERAVDLKVVGRIFTLYEYGYYGFFKPSIAEVLAMIPEHLEDVVVAWELIGPNNADDLSRQLAAVYDGYQVATAILYAKA
jgi:hypothetical protein